MYKILFVGNENWVLKVLSKKIEWEKYGFQVSTFTNKVNLAIELIHNIKPQLIFVEHTLPEVNGMDLIIMSLKENLHLEFAIISDFIKYLDMKRAMDLDVIGHYSKQLKSEEIISILIKAKRNIELKENEVKDRLRILLEDYNILNEIELKKIFLELGLNFDGSKTYRLFEVHGNGEINFNKTIKNTSINISSSKKIYIVEANELGADSYTLSSGVNIVGKSKIFRFIKDIKIALVQANTATYGRFILLGEKEFEYCEDSFFELKNKISTLKEYFNKSDIKEIHLLFDGLSSFFSGNSYNIKDVYWFYNMTLAILLSSSKESDIGFVGGFEQLANSYKDIDEMIIYLKKEFLNQIMTGVFIINEKSENNIVREIIDFVNKSFFEDITLKELSSKYYVSTSYISHIFKKKVGTTLTEYITTLRINYAKELLKDSRNMVQVIAEKVGYKEYFYFTRIFKKVTGMTPTQYRGIVNINGYTRSDYSEIARA